MASARQPRPAADAPAHVRLHAQPEPKPLANYLAEVFAPDCLAFAAPSYVQAHQQAVEAFEALLDAPATTADLTRLEVCRPDLTPLHFEILTTIAAHAAAGGGRGARHAAAALPAPDPERTLSDFFENVYRPLRLLGSTDGSVKLHRVVQRKWARFLDREPLMSDLNDLAAAAFFAHMLESGMTATTVNSYSGKLFAVWRLASRKREVATWPTMGKLREPKRAPKAWQLEEFSRLLESCRAERGQVAGIAADKWWYALSLVLYFTGGRIGAVLKVRWDSVDLERGRFVLEAENAKTLTEQRFELPARAVDALRAIAYPPRDVVFPWVKSPGLMWDEYSAILRRAGLPTDGKSKFHKIRRTSASHLKSVGGDPTSHLGHDSARTTAAYLDQEIVGITTQCHLLPDPTKLQGGKDGAA